MAEAFKRDLLDAAYCDLTIEDDEEDNAENMDVDWDLNSPMEVCKTKHEDGIQTLEPPPTSLCHYPLGHPAASPWVNAVYVSAVGNHRREISTLY
ncbi:hypothetical protein Y032_0249g125 [Ancylostoma ceylanicum]|nr:hypothetical protein Y032_0249g125 [Ancylostoma ceylanicum]